MVEHPKILLVDDEPDILDMYRDILGQIPSQPEVHTANTGAKAIAMLESMPFALLICDLKMPSMDGLQVLAIVRRKYPQLRTTVLTGLMDEQFRTRAYAMGIDLFLEKPKSMEETQRLLDCVESLIDREQDQAGFRGIQNKSLVDIIQLECLCKSSAVLRISSESFEGRIWFQDGDIIDAEVPGLKGEDAFRKILARKTGNFAILPPEPNRPRTIMNSYQGLLLESAQALDEAQAPEIAVSSESPGAESQKLSRIPGIDFGVVLTRGSSKPVETWAVDHVQPTVSWMTETLSQFRALGEEMRVGELRQIDASTMQYRVVIASRGNHDFLVAFDKTKTADQQKETLNQVWSQWDS